MKVVIDTNVFISGIFWKGPPYKVLDAWSKDRFKLVISTEIYSEYKRVLGELSQKYPDVNVDRVLELVGLHSEIVKTVTFARPVCKDPNDDMFIAAAISARAKYIVTGDKLLLEADGYQGVNIIKPAAFLKNLS